MPLHQRLQPGGPAAGAYGSSFTKAARHKAAQLAARACRGGGGAAAVFTGRARLHIVMKLLIKSLRKGNHWGKLCPVFIFLQLKVSQSRKQFMVSSILPKKRTKKFDFKVHIF